MDADFGDAADVNVDEAWLNQQELDWRVAARLQSRDRAAMSGRVDTFHTPAFQTGPATSWTELLNQDSTDDDETLYERCFTEEDRHPARSSWARQQSWCSRMPSCLLATRGLGHCASPTEMGRGQSWCRILRLVYLSGRTPSSAKPWRLL